MRALPKRVLVAATATVVVLGGGGYALLASRDAPPTARLRPGAGAGAGGRPDGEWVVASGGDGFVGYRVRERLGSISAPNDVVGRSSAVIDVASGRFRRLTDGPGYEHSPAWSPDGRRIAYVKDGAIHVMRSDGSGDRPLTKSRKDTAPAWSPDGGRISFVRDGNLHIARASGAGGACLRVGMLLTSGARWRPLPGRPPGQR